MSRVGRPEYRAAWRRYGCPVRAQSGRLLIGKFGPLARRWKDRDASYEAKHMWISKHYGTADHCEINPSHQAKRYEWSNISGTYQRERSDYRPLCPSCHRKLDHGDACRNGHMYMGNVYITKQGWRACKTCRRASQEKHRAKTD
jgi:hypothetical protein